MLFNFFLLFGFMVLLGFPGKPTAEVPKEIFRTRRRDSRQQDVLHRMNYCPTVQELEKFPDQIIDLFEMYKDLPGTAAKCSELQAAMENRRIQLMKGRRQVA